MKYSSKIWKMKKALNPMECFYHNEKTAGFATLGYIAELKDGKCLVQLIVIGCTRHLKVKDSILSLYDAA